MFSTKLIALVAALMAQEAVALNAHRHAHKDFHGKRDIVYVNEVETVVDWTTVTVYEDAPAPTPGPKKIYKEHHTTASTGFSSSANSTSSTHTSSTANSTSSTATSSSFSSSSTSTSLFTTPSLTPIYTRTTLATSKISSSSSTSSSSNYPVVPSASVAVYANAAAHSTVSSSSSSAAPTTTVNAFNSFTSAAGAAVSSVAAVVTSALAIPAITTSSSTAAAAATTTTSSGSYSGGSGSGSGKRGLAYNDGYLMAPFLNSGSKVSWSYNWGQKPPSDAASGVEYVPMLWGPNDADRWPDAVETAIAGGSTALLSFNEPDNAGQCNLDAASAATAHIAHMNPYSGKFKIGAPAITNSGSPGEGIAWLTDFLSACNGQCAIDFCPFHWYNVPDADEFLEHVANVYAACGKPVWITEFAPISGSDSDIATFLQTVMAALDSDKYAYVERYSYFMAATGSLLTSSTSLSTYGETFAYY